MNFTREPIIETVITPREGCKLVVRSSKGTNQEDYFVDAVEVVSFGHSFFFRSLERPKSFLVPMSDYEILELKETRMVLKNIPSERSIKIGGGRETQIRTQVHESEEAQPGEQPQMAQERLEKKRDRKRSRRRRMPGSMSQPHPEDISSAKEQQQPPAEGVEKAPSEAPPSFISKLFPPPPTLIKETLSRYNKPSEEETIIEEEKHPELPEDIEPPISEPKPKENETKFE